jgi:cytochrome c551/c552
VKKLIFCVSIVVSQTVFADEGEALAKQKACLGCHTTKHIGISYPPAFERVAEKHKDNKDYIKNVIRNGKGKMPAHPTLTDAEINLLADYILTFGDK